MHIAADRQWAEVMSIPRDSWVSIPSCQMGNGQQSSPHSFKINEAFAIGNMDGNHTVLGVACTIKTLERDTGIHIDHFVVINFSGLRDMVRRPGRGAGVQHDADQRPAVRPAPGGRAPPADRLPGAGYVRARYTLGNGSDLERIKRQQAFMSSLIQRARSKLLDPLAIYRFLDAATKSLTIDSQLGGIHGLYYLGRSLGNLPESKVTFFTLPTFPRSEVDPSDTANVLWTQPLDSQIFAAFQDDVPVSQALLDEAQAGLLPARLVRVTVLNGSGQPGLAKAVAAQLREYGYRIQLGPQAEPGVEPDVDQVRVRSCPAGDPPGGHGPGRGAAFHRSAGHVRRACPDHAVGPADRPGPAHFRRAGGRGGGRRPQRDPAPRLRLRDRGPADQRPGGHPGHAVRPPGQAPARPDGQPGHLHLTWLA